MGHRKHLRNTIAALSFFALGSLGSAADTATSWEQIDSHLRQEEYRLRDQLQALDTELVVEDILAFGGDERLDLKEKEAFLSGKYLGIRLRRISLNMHRSWNRAFSVSTARKTAPVVNTPEVQWNLETAREELYWVYGSALITQADEAFPHPKITKYRNAIAQSERQLQTIAQSSSPKHAARKAHLRSLVRRTENLISVWEDREDALMLDSYWRGLSEGFGISFPAEVQERLIAAKLMMRDTGIKIPHKEGCAQYLL